MEDNAEDSEISRNVKVSEYIKKINSATPQGTPETQRRFHVRNKVDDFSDCNITELPVFKEPICLLDTSEDGTLEIQQKAILQLNMLDKPFVVVGIAGLYRTGKSYLMNRLAGRNNGFALGSTIQSKTKGIWVWAREHPIYPEKFLLLLDTEGLGDAEKGNENHDNWIFSMTTLLSSTLIFNVLNAINEDSLEKLNFITVISKRIRFSSEESEEESDFDLISPLFIFALRDFSLDLEIDQQEVTSDEYMEHCLQLKEGESEDVKRYNRPRLCIRTYFKKRKCFTFDRPVSKKKMKYLDLFIDSGLSKEFKEEVDTFVEYVHKEAPEKKLHTGQPVSGPVFCTLVTTYLDAINNGVIPNTESAIKALSLVENQKTVEKSLELYKRLMHDRLELPVPTEDLLCRIHLQCHQEAVSFFMERALMDEGDAKLAELNKLIGISFEEMKEKDKEASMEKCWATLKKLEASLQHKLQNGIYATEGGYITYQQDFQTILDQYNERKDLGNQKNECQLEYRQMKIAESAIVLATDKFVSEKERIAREEQERALQAEREKQAAERERQTVVRMTQEKDLMLQQTKREIETRNANQLKELKPTLPKCSSAKIT